LKAVALCVASRCLAMRAPSVPMASLVVFSFVSAPGAALRRAIEWDDGKQCRP